jgi:hypothetical protein
MLKIKIVTLHNSCTKKCFSFVIKRKPVVSGNCSARSPTIMNTLRLEYVWLLEVTKYVILHSHNSWRSINASCLYARTHPLETEMWISVWNLFQFQNICINHHCIRVVDTIRELRIQYTLWPLTIFGGFTEICREPKCVLRVSRSVSYSI